MSRLGAKSYQSQFEEAPDYVVMFVPGEHFVAAALEHDPELWDFAFRNKVLLATPTNLVAIARTVAQVWRQDAAGARSARDRQGSGPKSMTGSRWRRSICAGSVAGWKARSSNYNKFVGSFERNVLYFWRARRLRDKGIEIGKREIEDVPQIDAAPRHAKAEDDPVLLGGEGGTLDEAAE
jgi:DNA recombination protein RmuC